MSRRTKARRYAAGKRLHDDKPQQRFVGWQDNGDGPRTRVYADCGVYQVRNNLSCGNVPAAYRGNRQMTRQKNRNARLRGYKDFRHWVGVVMALARARMGQ